MISADRFFKIRVIRGKTTQPSWSCSCPCSSCCSNRHPCGPSCRASSSHRVSSSRHASSSCRTNHHCSNQTLLLRQCWRLYPQRLPCPLLSTCTNHHCNNNMTPSCSKLPPSSFARLARGSAP